VDTLTVKGISKDIDGEYDCDLLGMLTLTTDESLTNNEAHLVKSISGVRGGEVIEAFLAGDTDVRMALTIIVLARHGKRVDERLLGPLPAGTAVFEVREEEEEEEIPPTSEGEVKEESPSPNGGRTSGLTLASRDADPEVIGVPA
jgi:hypothetical protein